ncbi:MAG: hypothetical protein G01um101472_322 [Parcubacteria group bacterium Gr01-1014_72]|nr:MAG: hypothetical protein G01um101472_322 [Parcubacteria group bacterium Gr01-1014_72]
MQIHAIKTSVFREGEHLVPFIARFIKHLPEKSILVITSKIIALAERRTKTIESVKTKERLIRKESQFAISTKYVWLTIKDGMVMASAGIDESNANGKLILLPKNSFKAAGRIRGALCHHYRVKELGILITDSRTMPLRSGVTGVTIGYAGFKGLHDYRGTPDIFGRKFRFSQTNVADGLAAAAVVLMGEGAEQRPLARIQGAPVEFCDSIAPTELLINPADDIYRPFFNFLPKKPWERKKK